MRVLIHDKRHRSAEPTKKFQSRVNATFAKFCDKGTIVKVTLANVKGPRRGIDKECQVLV